jgi:cell division transport system permease protein
VKEVLQQVGLEDKENMLPNQLSGGEQQRVALARALVNNPSVIFADEPTGNLDPDTSWEIMKLFEKVNFHGTTVVMATHNREIVNTIKKRVLAVENGVNTVMKARTLARHFREGVKGLGRHGWMAYAAISSVSIALLILGVFLLLAMNVNAIAETVENQAEIRVYIDETATQAETQELENKIRNLQEIKSIQFISKDEGLKELKERLGKEGELLNGLEEENPLRDTLVVKTSTADVIPQVAKTIQGFDKVANLNYGEGYVENLIKVTNTIRNVGLIFIVGLAFTAMFLISNTIRMTIDARRREIEIMRLVGATKAFIRWPFFIEGLLMGVIGALIPILILAVGYQTLLGTVANQTAQLFIKLLPAMPLLQEMSLVLLSIGAFIGIWGTMLSVRRFLKI